MKKVPSYAWTISWTNISFDFILEEYQPSMVIHATLCERSPAMFLNLFRSRQAPLHSIQERYPWLLEFKKEWTLAWDLQVDQQSFGSHRAWYNQEAHHRLHGPSRFQQICKILGERWSQIVGILSRLSKIMLKSSCETPEHSKKQRSMQKPMAIYKPCT